MSEIREIYAAGKNFTLLLAVTAWTNLTFVCVYYFVSVFDLVLQVPRRAGNLQGCKNFCGGSQPLPLLVVVV